jgi:glutaredoxin 3
VERGGAAAEEGGASMTAVAPVLMYSTAVCPYCVRAEQLLRARGVVEIEKVRIDLDPERRNEMQVRTGRRTVPQIFIGATHVGGADDLVALDRSGRLLPLLAGETA